MPPLVCVRARAPPRAPSLTPVFCAAQIDLDNDEVRIYLTSSQEVFQQDDSGSAGGASVDFEQRRNHRTQLIISTNDINNDGGYDTTTAATAKSAFAHVETTLWAGDPYGVGCVLDGLKGNVADVEQRCDGAEQQQKH